MSNHAGGRPIKKINNLHTDVHRIEKILIAASVFNNIHVRINHCFIVQTILKEFVQLHRDKTKFYVTDLKKRKINTIIKSIHVMMVKVLIIM